MVKCSLYEVYLIVLNASESGAVGYGTAETHTWVMTTVSLEPGISFFGFDLQGTVHRDIFL